MSENVIVKDGEIEVCSEDEGFRGAWYRAILEDNPTKSGRKKLQIRYMTLLDEDGSSPLTESVDQSFIRPVPPENQYEGIVLVEGLVVDADYKDGWWTGVVVKILEDEKKYLVYFDSPPDIIQFERKQLRAHLRYTGWKWVKPEIKELDKSMFSPGTMVEVSSVKDKVEVSWFPAMIIKEIEGDDEKKLIVKDCNKLLSCNGDEARPNMIFDKRCVRPTPPPFSCEVYTLLECVEAFRGGFGWRQGLVRGILADKRYMVSLEATKEESVYKHSDLRPFKVWEDGVWHNGPKRKPVNETPSNVVKKKLIRFSPGTKPMTPTKHVRRSVKDNGEKLVKAATGELRKKRIDDKTHPIITPEVTSKAKESISPVTPSLVINTTPLRQTEAKRSVEKTQNGSGNGSTREKMPEEESSNDTSKKRKREETDETCNGSINDDAHRPLSAWIRNLSTDVEETQANDTLTVLPFAKKSPFWKTYETKEEYKTVTQNPHFRPLFEAKEEIREWSAVGMMVTFYGLLDEVKDLELDVSSSKLSSLSISFAELEKHGFDVSMALSRIDKVSSLRDGRAKKEEERKCLETKIEAEKSENRIREEEMAELKRRIMELKRLEAVGKEKKEAGEKKIGEMKSSVETIDQEIEELEIEFQTTMAAPW